MTSPADLPPPEPDRGDPVRLRWFWGLFFAALVCIFAASVLASFDYWVAMASVFAAAFLFLVAAVVVLAGGKEKQ